MRIHHLKTQIKNLDEQLQCHELILNSYANKFSASLHKPAIWALIAAVFYAGKDKFMPLMKKSFLNKSAFIFYALKKLFPKREVSL